jgi:flagellar biosynthesis component FlhA
MTLPKILADTRRTNFMIHYILRAWGYAGLLTLLALALLALFKMSVVLGAAVLILVFVSLYLSSFAKLTYDQKIREEEYAAREAKREAERAEHEAQLKAANAERDQQWKAAQIRRERDQAEKEKLAELESAARQKRIQDLSRGLSDGMEQTG